MKCKEVKTIIDVLGIKSTVISRYIGMDNSNFDKMICSAGDIPLSKQGKLVDFFTIGLEKINDLVKK